MSLGVAVNSAPSVPVAELAELYALDTELYCHTFFGSRKDPAGRIKPGAFRQRTPDFHRDIFAALDDPGRRHVAFEVFRGGGKTTILRAYTSKRIAYGTSRTIMFISASQAHALKSARWLRRAVEFNKKWTTFYSLEPGAKWTDEWLEIRHQILDITITIVAAGITGQTRGLNIDDYRPDLIIVDDPSDEENTATAEQREKANARFFGAVEKSLVPAAENPEAKIVLLQTSLHREDLINKCHADSQWNTRRFGCFDEMGQSRWPEMWSTETLIADKQSYANRSQLLLWLREMECTVGDEETAVFKSSWLQFWELPPERMIIAIGIDPTPPPTEAQQHRGLRDKDSEVITVAGMSQGKIYLLEQAGIVDHDPEWTVSTTMQLVKKWRPIRIRVETVAYQRTLKYYLEKAMREAKLYCVVEEFDDKRKKRHRIFQAFSGICAAGMFFAHRTMLDFQSQFTAYPNTSHDDYLDSAALATEALLELVDMENDESIPLLDDEVKALPPSWRVAP